jgi:serine/threonine protein phosphatase PrpC
MNQAHNSPQRAVQDLVTEALRLGSMDNISALVIMLNRM